MMAAAGPLNDQLINKMLKSAVQSVKWTYIIYWPFCSQRRVLVWGDGYYNGPIKTRKIRQSMEVSIEDEVVLSRSEQLKELYDSLNSHDQELILRRPSVALSPRDLTESEWFYLVSISYLFPPGVGLVGVTHTTQQYQWFTRVNKADNKVFTRATIAESARIEMVVCIPILNGVVELGTTQKVEEDVEFIQHVKLFFTGDNAISVTINPIGNTFSMDEYDIVNEEDEEEDEEDEEEEEEEEVNWWDVEANGGHISCVEELEDNTVMDSNDLLQFDMPEDITFGLANDGSANLESGLHELLATGHNASCRPELNPSWSHNLGLHDLPNIQPCSTGTEVNKEEKAREDTYYPHTVTSILFHNQSTRWFSLYLASGDNNRSSFTAWTSDRLRISSATTSNSQRLLKYILFVVPVLHSKSVNGGESVGSQLQKTKSHEGLSVNHVLAERRRREKLNQLFTKLRSMVPLVTKRDRASILTNTIEYLELLNKKIQDLEAPESLDRPRESGKRKAAREVMVDVSIIESDALVELQCLHREGLLLDVMQKLRELGAEITTVHSYVDGGTFTAEMRAKVKVKAKGCYNAKKISITQVKKAINQIITPSY